MADSEVDGKLTPLPVPGPPTSQGPTRVDRNFGQTPVVAPPTHRRSLVGKRYGKYRVLREIGRGGMGVVYEAYEESLARTVALKQLEGGGEDEAEERERFLREARIGARLVHPGIVAVHDVGEEEGAPFFTMDYVRGCTLAAWITIQPLPIRDAVQLIRDVTRAIAHAHAQGVVHRDLKPANVLCEWPGGAPPVPAAGGRLPMPRVVVTDFGLGKLMDTSRSSALTVSGTVLGTPAYMPPEQAAGDAARIAPWSDVYSLGAMLYELLTGARPFEGASPYEVCAKVLRDDPRSPRSLNRRLSRDLETIVMKAMQKDPRRRYPTAVELLEDLERFLAGEAVQARPPGLRERLGRMIRRDPRAAFLLLLALLAPVGVALGLWASVSAYRASYDRSSGPYWAALRAIAAGRPLVVVRGHYLAALALAPDHAEVHLGLAELDLDEGRFADALQHTLDAGAGGTAAPHLISGLVWLELGRPDRARTRFTGLPPGERDGGSRSFARSLTAWLDDPGVRPPPRGFRWPPTARALAAQGVSPARRLRESPVWSDLEPTLRLRETYPMVLLAIHALVLDGEADVARDLLAHLRRVHPRRPSVLAWSAFFEGGSYADALTECDRPELRLLAAEAARKAGDEASRQEHLGRATADLERRSAAAKEPDEAAYWRALAEDVERR